MKRLWILSGCLFVLVVCFVLCYGFAADYGDGFASGTYLLAEIGETLPARNESWTALTAAMIVEIGRSSAKSIQKPSTVC